LQHIPAKGYKIKVGKKVFPIEQVTISGNFYDLLLNIKLIGNDLLFKSTISSPSIYAGNLSVGCD
jgi:PmbA protein